MAMAEFTYSEQSFWPNEENLKTKKGSVRVKATKKYESDFRSDFPKNLQNDSLSTRKLRNY